MAHFKQSRPDSGLGLQAKVVPQVVGVEFRVWGLGFGVWGLGLEWRKTQRNPFSAHVMRVGIPLILKLRALRAGPLLVLPCHSRMLEHSTGVLHL
jgi:hypothetical protein